MLKINCFGIFTLLQYSIERMAYFYMFFQSRFKKDRCSNSRKDIINETFREFRCNRVESACRDGPSMLKIAEFQ